MAWLLDEMHSGGAASWLEWGALLTCSDWSAVG